MKPTFIDSPSSISLKGNQIEGALDRQQKIAGFDQERLSSSTVLLIGAGGLGGPIALTLVRKGVGRLIVLDHDVIEASNLNRQRFYASDIGENKALALVRNLQRECTHATDLVGHGLRLEEAIELGVDLSCEVAICGVDNNPARLTTSRHFRTARSPVIFTAVSADADHGYVFVQECIGPCFRCLFPDARDGDPLPCPGTPAIADILQVVTGIAVYAVDSLLMNRPRGWNYRHCGLARGDFDGARTVSVRDDCSEVHNSDPVECTSRNQNEREN
jgi:molybdopterin/thiamine biosynthesis adenylyltransferase